MRKKYMEHCITPCIRNAFTYLFNSTRPCGHDLDDNGYTNPAARFINNQENTTLLAGEFY